MFHRAAPSVNYYEHHIGDYQRKTAHLSLAEHGAYLLMLHSFYATERPLPKDRKLLYRLLRATRASEQKAIDSVAGQFWESTEDGITNRRAEQVLDKYRKWLTQQKANGSQGGRPQKTHGLSNGNPAGYPTETQTKPMGGYRARVPLPTSHDDVEGLTPLPPLKKGAPRQRRSEHRAGLDEARIVWSELIASAGAKPKRDTRIQAALDAIGGWPAVRMRTEFEETKLQRAFCEAYLRGGESAHKAGPHQPIDPDDLREREEAARADG